MDELSDVIKRRLDLVLEDACRGLPSGGDHETRKLIAAQLIEAVQKGKTTVGELGLIARKAVSDIKNGGGQ